MQVEPITRDPCQVSPDPLGFQAVSSRSTQVVQVDVGQVEVILPSEWCCRAELTRAGCPSRTAEQQGASLRRRLSTAMLEGAHTNTASPRATCCLTTSTRGGGVWTLLLLMWSLGMAWTGWVSIIINAVIYRITDYENAVCPILKQPWIEYTYGGSLASAGRSVNHRQVRPRQTQAHCGSLSCIQTGVRKLNLKIWNN